MGSQINFASALPLNWDALKYCFCSGPAATAPLFSASAVIAGSSKFKPMFWAAAFTAWRAETVGAASNAARLATPRFAAASGSAMN